MFEKKENKKTTEAKSEKVEKKEVEKKVTSAKKIAKSAFYFKGKHFQTDSVVDLPKEDLDFLESKGKLK